MFTTQEGEGWQQLGEGLMPNSAKDAGVLIDGFSKMGDQALHSAFGGASLPDLHDALGAMFGPQPVEINSALPHLDLFDSGSAATSPLSGAEAGAPAATPGTGFESAGMQTGLQATPAGGFESAGLQSGMQTAGPGTIETLHAAGLEPSQALANVNSPGMESMKLQGPGADAATQLTDASSPLANIGKAFTDIISKMGDMIGSIAQGPMGILGGLLNFLLTVFTEMLSSIGQAVEETAKAAASLAADVWKKQLGTTT